MPAHGQRHSLRKPPALQQPRRRHRMIEYHQPAGMEGRQPSSNRQSRGALRHGARHAEELTNCLRNTPQQRARPHGLLATVICQWRLAADMVAMCCAAILQMRPPVGFAVHVAAQDCLGPLADRHNFPRRQLSANSRQLPRCRCVLAACNTIQRGARL